MQELIDYTHYLQAGWHVFPLHKIVQGACGCGDIECTAVGKHPISGNWQHITVWDEDQLAFLEDDEGLTGVNQLLDSFGVNLHHLGLFVVDVDARNGGVQSLARLETDLGIDLRAACNFIVETGSGNGSLHMYFYARDVKLHGSLKQYAGIDFKSSGFVVGSSCDHKSGEWYRTIKGNPSLTSDAPLQLIDLLERKERMKSTFESKEYEYTDGELHDIVMSIKDHSDYERWIRVGMAIHHASSGAMSGFDLWDKWSSQSDSYDGSQMGFKWHSFGKNIQSQLTIATLLLWAKNDGYSEPVAFVCNDESLFIDKDYGFDINKPPHLVGQITEWINSRSMYPRPALAVAAALMVVSNAAGLRYRIAGFNTSLNLIVFGVASSGSGKGAIINSVNELHKSIGLSKATYGGIKSEQEIIRNQIQHQGAFYVIDEVGSLLGKIANSRKSGKAAYLEGVVAQIMSLYSSAAATVQVTGDLKAEMREMVQRDIAKVVKRMDAGDTGLEHQEDQLKKELESVDEGIVNPFTSFFGISEPSSFNEAINGDPWLVTGGFVGRSLVFTEHDDVPHRKDVGTYDSRQGVPFTIAAQLGAMYSGGHSPEGKIKRYGDVEYLPLSDDAAAYEQEVYQYWHAVGKAEQDDGTGMQTLTMRAPELTLKVAGILGVAGGVVTLECLKWADALVRSITSEKISKAKANQNAGSKDIGDRSQAVLDAIASAIPNGEEITIGGIVNKFRHKFTKAQIQDGLDWLAGEGKITAQSKLSPNRKTTMYYSK